ncbi:hypothetical protein SBDP1_420031 [Syntrophobacter sp. SbD1]|nr:hypothetical protein SBDP1_420031 [Syntrophobacter sp. SbD1]
MFLTAAFLSELLWCAREDLKPSAFRPCLSPSPEPDLTPEPKKLVKQALSSR